MENIIKRTISLEPIKTRMEMHGDYINTMQSSDIHSNENIWGQIPYDIVLEDNYSQYIFMPKTLGLTCENGLYSNVSTKANVVRYSNFRQLLAWLEEFIRTTDFYMMGVTPKGINWTKLETEDVFFKENIPLVILPSLPHENEDKECLDSFGNVYVCGDETIVGINYQYNIFYSTFRTITNNILNAITIDNKCYKKICPNKERGELLFLKLAEKYQSGKFKKSIPYFDLPIYIESDIDSLGQYDTVEEEWKENEIYHDGQIVSSNGISYKLKCNDSSNTEMVNIYGELIDAIENKKETNDGWLAEYKCSTENINNDKVWQKYLETDGTNKVIEDAVTESRLSSLRRNKISVDDEGNVLPFIITDEEDGSFSVELPFMIGCSNIYADNDANGKNYADIMEKITLLSEDENIIKELNCYSDENSSEIKSVSVKVDELGDIKNGKIQFQYILGNEVEFTNGYIYTTDKNYGIRYSEEYSFEIKDNVDILYDGRNRNFKYIDVKYDLNKTINTNEALENGLEDIILSNISYQIKNKEEMNNFPIIKDEFTIGVEDISKDINVTVDRGSSSAFERINILSEINTFQDLNNYRNNLFEL